MQQPVGIEGVVDAAVAVVRKANPSSAPRVADQLAVFWDCFGRRAVLFSDVFDDVLTFGGHVRVQFERLEMDLGLHLIAQLSRAWVRPRRPIMHQGQDTSLTKSIFRGVLMEGNLAARNAP